MMTRPSDLVSAQSCQAALIECMALGYAPGHLGGRCGVADDTRPTRAETDTDQWHHAWDDEGHTWADMVRGVAVDSTGWGYLPGHAPIYVGLDGA